MKFQRKTPARASVLIVPGWKSTFKIKLFLAREGVIIDDDKTTLFNELVTLENVILTSRNDVREMQDNVNDPETTLGADF